MVNIARRGSEGSEILDGYTVAMDEAGIGYERFDAAELMRRWPQFRVPDDHEALYQPDGGILDIRKAGAVHVALARARGATVLGGAGVTAIEPGRDGVRLITAAGEFEAEKVVLCAGAWTRGLLQGLGVDWPIRLTQEQVTYYATPNLADFAPDRFPIWLWHGDGDDEYYGFPVYGEVATKAAAGPRRAGGERGRAPVAARRRARAARRALRGVDPPRLHRARSCTRAAACTTCRPTATSSSTSCRASRGSRSASAPGHAAKFAGLLGRILSELAIDGATAFPIEPFRADRPALADPGFVPGYRLGGVAAAT